MNNQEKNAHAHAIAAALGGTFQPSGGDGEPLGCGTVTMPDGVAFWLSVGGWAGADKVHVGTHYPQHQTGASRFNQGRMNSSTSQRDFDRTRSYNAPIFDGINMTVNKTPTLAARDIQRRFLPTYAPLYAMAVEYCAKQVEYLDAWEANDKAARAASQGVTGLSVDYVARDSVTFKVTVLPADIEALAAFLKTLG